MKILVAYDGSVSGDGALYDLARAGRRASEENAGFRDARRGLVPEVGRVPCRADRPGQLRPAVLRTPERVERVVLLDPALQVLPHVALDMAEGACADLSFASPEEAIQSRIDSGRYLHTPRAFLEEDAREHLEAGPDGRLRFRFCRSAVVTAWSDMATPHPPAPRVPTLLVLGARSWLVLDEQVEELRARLGELLQVVTVPGGHTVFWDAFAETADAVDGFLREG